MKLVEAIRLARSIKSAGPRKFTQHMVPHVVRPAQIIWNKALGGVFLLFAVIFFGYAVRYFRGLSAPGANPVGLAFAVFLGVTMGVFGLSSFLKARRLSRL